MSVGCDVRALRRRAGVENLEMGRLARGRRGGMRWLLGRGGNTVLAFGVSRREWEKIDARVECMVTNGSGVRIRGSQAVACIKNDGSAGDRAMCASEM